MDKEKLSYLRCGSRYPMRNGIDGKTLIVYKFYGPIPLTNGIKGDKIYLSHTLPERRKRYV